MFKFSQGMLPLCFDELFRKNEIIHDYNTRNRFKYRLPQIKTGIYQRSLSFRGVVIWNYFSEIIDVQCSFHTFKNRLKKYLTLNTIPDM